ncbi:hemoglobin-like flavoprotein [Streptomyces demainii]|uniref:Hemoglobin-like flavoprotein n=1 Tax=Streptomyces demainii TaxID=588122 RepID=A0ABT9KKP7_9ACTN|nr:hemoglobin-like flavoprotein [Streptomyces demainii]
MDAPTTTSSAGSDGSGGNSGDWGWFTPSRKPAEDQPRTQPRTQDRTQDRPSDERTPNRPVNPVRPVGTGADRRTPVEPGPASGPWPGDRPAGGPPATGPEEQHQRPDEAASAPHDVRPGLDPRFAVPETASPDAVLLRRTMAEIEPISDKVTSYFYALLFVQHPELRPLFPAAMDAQRDRLFKAVLTAARLVDDNDILTEFLSRLGRGHRKYGTQPEHYPAVGECLIGALTRYAVNTWSDEARGRLGARLHPVLPDHDRRGGRGRADRPRVVARRGGRA